MTMPGSPPDDRRPKPAEPFGAAIEPVTGGGHAHENQGAGLADSSDSDRSHVTNIQITKWSALALAVSLLIVIVASAFAQRLPAPETRPELHDEPRQTALAAGDDKVFNETLQGHTYTITPRFNYQLTGLVVSMSEAMGWQDITHKSVGDFLNTNDICVIWGSNAETLDLSWFTFTHGDWTCYVATRSSAAWAQFKMDGLSNNHVLPATPELAAQFRSVHIGDQIEIDGRLVNYSIDGRPPRITSTVRTDTGNGACEIIYVTGFRFLKRHHLFLYRLAHMATLAAGASLLVLLVSLFVLPYVRPDDVG